MIDKIPEIINYLIIYCFSVVLFQYLYGRLFGEKKISDYFPEVFFKNCCFKRLTNKARGLSIFIYLKINKVRNSKTPYLLLLVFFALCSNLYSYGQCPAGSAPTGTNLVVNGNFSAGNTGFSSSYYYCNSTNCLNPESRYAVGANANSFHGLFSRTDHTTGNGKFMIVNGAGTPNTSVWCQTISVSPNSTYIFSTWVCSLYPSSPAKLQFSINGSLLGSVFTAPSTTNSWIKFSATWNSGSNTSITICIKNQNTTASGNDFGLDDITFQKCCVPITANAGSNVSLCFGQTSTTLTASGSGGTPPYTYLWNNVNPAQSIVVGTGIYTVKISHAAQCPPAYASVSVISYPVAITANAGTDKTVCKQSPVTTINGSVAGAMGGIWTAGGGVFSPNNTTLSGATYSPTTAELAAGFSDLTLTTTGNGVCPPVSDIVRINYVGFTGVISVTPSHISCFGANNGSATVNIAGGTPPYSYSWNTSPAQSAATASNLGPGTYSVTITNGLGCTIIKPVVITQPSPVGLASSITHVSCPGGSNGSITITVSGGTPPYSYLWNNGATTSQLSAIPSQSYSLTVTDANACQKTASYTINQPEAIAIVLTPTPVSCFNGSDGSAGSAVSGGTAPYSYNWSSGATSPVALGLQAGTVILTITDYKGCVASKPVTVTQPPALITTTSITNETCNSMNDGTAMVLASGGTPGYTYLWSSGTTSTQISNLPSQTYSVTATDIKGCTSTAFATINAPDPLAINFSSQVNVSCFAGNNGSVTANPVGGTLNYTYLWSNGETTAQISNLSAQTYTITVTDANGCIAAGSVTITQPVAPLSLTVSSLPATCYGAGDGAVASSATGGTGPYTYIWAPGNLAGQNISNLIAGTYTITATDILGCIITNSVTITQPDQLILLTSSVNSDCGQPNGQSSVAVSGGVSPYTYLWSPSGGTDATASGLVTGAYTVSVTDFTGCAKSQFGNVDDNSAPVVNIHSVINVSCYGGSDGSAKVSTSGGISPFTYSWMPSGGTDSSAAGLTAGSYTVTVTGANGCQSLATISPDLTQPPPISITFNKSPVSCFGGSDGSATASVSGGTSSYTYLWSNSSTDLQISNLSSQTYTIQVTDANNCVETMPVTISEPDQLTTSFTSTTPVSCFGFGDGTATASTIGGTPVYFYNWMPSGGNGNSATGLSAGTYTLTTSDVNGCVENDSVTITQPGQALSSTSTVSPTSCFGGSNGTVSISTQGGTPGYNYQWTPSVSVNDSAFGLAPGNYTVLISDSNSCTANLSVNITEPSAITGTIVSVNPSCDLANGSVSVQLSGGTPPYSYLWLPGSTTNTSINNLQSGIYNVNIKDNFNCELSLSSTLSNIPAPTLAFTSFTNVSCAGGNDGSATITINQGTPPYSISWSPSGGNSLTATQLNAGIYTVSITDTIGCQLYDSVNISEPSPLAVSISSINPVLCNGENTGSISVSATGGTGPLYTYWWAPVSSDSSTAANLTIGTYTVNVSDQNNCIKAISATITEPSLLTSIIDTVIHASCFEGFGSATVIASGGVLPYTYSWSAPASGQTGSEVNNMIAGSYTVTITDTNGCVTSNHVIIKQPLQVLTISGENDTLCLGQSVILTASATGGEGGYYYAWQPSGAITSGTLPVTPVSDITYTVVAYDQIGCPGTPETISAIVYNLTAANVEAIAASPICPGQSSTVYVETSGSTGPLTYQWNENLGTEAGIYTVAPSQPTTYIVTVSNKCGLSVIDSIDVIINPQPAISLLSSINALCVPGTVLFFDNSVTGNPDDPITIWNWNFGDGTTSTEQNPAHGYNNPGTFLVALTVSTAGGCTSDNLSVPMTITAHPAPTASFSMSSTNLNLPYDVLILNNQSTGANSYFWNFGDGGNSVQINPQYVYASIGIFRVQLIAMSQYGCADTAFAEVTTNADVIFPNVFTPNPNGSQGGNYDINNLSNDIFFPYSSGVIDFKLEIFNRWGEQIFESLDIKQGWDGYYRGIICQQDVYVWKAYIKLNNGKIFHKNGDVTLLRY